MMKVGLTGSIAVGKSFVLDVLRELGARTIDADAIAREVVERGTPGLDAVINEFGKEILKPDGSLDRSRLGQMLFADEVRRQKLNSILHPFIFKRQDEIMRQWEAETPDAIAVIDAALMIESGGYKRFDKLIVVFCEQSLQRERLMQRNNLTIEQADQRISAQMSTAEKRKFADFEIDTSRRFEDTRRQVVEIVGKLRHLQ